jgi:PleD family two-component response regulator
MSKKILAVVDDMFFMVKIGDAAKRAGFEAQFLKSEKDVLAQITAERPQMVIVDLNGNSVEPVRLIEKIKGAAAMKGLTVIGFVSHVQGELKQAAHDAGADMVLARSAFSSNLPAILKRHASAA